MKIVLKTLAAALLVASALAAPTAFAQGTDANAALIAHGAYLARVGDCMACHSTSSRKPYSGGLALKTDLGTIYSTNITPSKVRGIGGYTEQQFADAVRKGVRADGSNLYPAMPYPDYQKTSDEDIHALYTYFMRAVEPNDTPGPVTHLSFPFSLRWGMSMYNWAFTPKSRFTPPDNASEQVRRGAYIVESLGHCGSCHTPRGLPMNEKAFDGSDALFLTGGALNGWSTPSLREMDHWSEQDIVDYLETGRNSKAAVAGEMTSVVYNSTSHMTDGDVKAVAAYLKSLSTPAAAHASTAPALTKPDSTTAKLTAAKNLTLGERLYIDNCAACHFVNGKGAARVFPHLDGATIANSGNATALIQVILEGAQTPSTAKAPSVLPMPGFASRLSDQEVAQLATFVRSGWSNHASVVSPSLVEKVRMTSTER
jgi:alcohol dehydrogenase (quinone), cytochrome c subunit